MENNNFVSNEELSPTVVEVEFDDRPKLSALYHFLIFVGGIILIFVFQIATEGFFTQMEANGQDILAATLQNFTIYLLVFVSLGLILWALKVLNQIVTSYTKVRTYIYGLFYGFVVILASITVSALTNLIFGPTESNLNQVTIEKLVLGYPIISFVWIVLLGPVVEEVIYRVGLFGSLRKLNRYLAYGLSALIFAFIHFNIPLTDQNTIDQALLIREFINLPGYFISGLLFGYIYDKAGFGVSSVAHITNNLVSFLVTLVLGLL